MNAGNDQSCFHCGLPLPEDEVFPVTIRGEERKMCCRGCQAVAQAIVDGGLESFYDHRTETSRKADELIPEELQRFDLYDEEAVQASFVKVADDDRRTASLILEGITCAACVWLNERHVRALPGVLSFDVNYTTHRARVEWDNSQLHLSDILKAITAIGYVAHPFDPGRQEAIYKKERKRALRRLAIAGVCAMQVMMLAVALYSGDYYGMDEKMQTFMRWVSMLLATPVVFYASTDFFRNAWRDLRHWQVSMDVPVSLAIGGAYSASVWATVTGGHEVYFYSVTMFSFFLLSSRFLEMGARHRAGQAAEALVRLLPATATRLLDGKEEVVSIRDLVPGDRVLIRPGETVPADGIIVEGVSSVDESLLTGESLPQLRRQDDEIIGGSLNVESPLVMRIDKTGEDTVVSGIVQLLERAQSEKPKIARYADRVAGWFVSAVLLLAQAGVPFTSGFVAKFEVIVAAVDGDRRDALYSASAGCRVTPTAFAAIELAGGALGLGRIDIGDHLLGEIERVVIGAEHRGGAARRLLQAFDDLECCAFARPVWAHDDGKPLGRDFEIHRTQQGLAAPFHHGS